MKRREHVLTGHLCSGSSWGLGSLLRWLSIYLASLGTCISVPRTHGNKSPLSWWHTFVIQHQGSWYSRSPGTHHLVSTAYLTSYIGMRDLVSKIKVEDVLGIAPQGDLWLLHVSVYTCAPLYMYMHTDTKKNKFKGSYLRGHVLEDALGWGKSLENSRRFRRSILILTLKGSALPPPYSSWRNAGSILNLAVAIHLWFTM